MNDLLAAIDVRRSRRAYEPVALESADAKALRSSIQQFNQEADLNMELIIDNGDAFADFKATYGMFSGVRNYIALIADPEDFFTQDKLGYYGEKLVLDATNRGLGTCWVAGSFDRKATPVKLGGSDIIVAVITVGKVATELSRREKMMKRLFHRGTKSIEDMVIAQEPLPEWFLSGMRAVQKAPSAVNRQPVKFTLANETVTAYVDPKGLGRPPLDLGIAKLHFEIGSGGGSWTFGNSAPFSRS
jgi:nitroreductase